MAVKINLLSTIDPYYVHGGGGEAVVADLLKELPAFVDLRRMHLLGAQQRLFDDAEACVLIDTHNAPHLSDSRLVRLAEVLPRNRVSRYWNALEKAIMGRRYVHLQNAYVDVCDRGYLPCTGRLPTDSACTRPDLRESRLLARRSHGTCFADSTRALHQQAVRSWFLSPLHRDTSVSIIGAAAQLDLVTRLLRPTLDVHPFIAAKKRGARRDLEHLFVGSFTAAKGAEEIIRLYGASLTVVGRCDADLARHVKQHVPWVPSADLPDFYARARRLVLLPTWPEPFGRVVAEAALSGCEVISNGMVGALSWERDLSDPDFYRGSAHEFWQELTVAH